MNHQLKVIGKRKGKRKGEGDVVEKYNFTKVWIYGKNSLCLVKLG